MNLGDTQRQLADVVLSLKNSNTPTPLAEVGKARRAVDKIHKEVQRSVWAAGHTARNMSTGGYR